MAVVLNHSILEWFFYMAIENEGPSLVIELPSTSLLPYTFLGHFRDLVNSSRPSAWFYKPQSQPPAQI